MTRITNRKGAFLGTALAALALGLGGVAASVPAFAGVPAGAARPSQSMVLSINEGKLVRLPVPMSDLFIANDTIADVHVRSPTPIVCLRQSPRQHHGLCHRQAGPRRLRQQRQCRHNLGSVDSMLNLAMPEATITATPVGNMVAV